ncbi:Histone-lysine N-methyltransferase SETMAR [Melipona quadrifasciata]|uniref:Histone-lysine N-methyltransferase SETMAR n=1 Tax=Melipona quadrifasciata TaxID=166423 RepID=A0A0M9A5C1_9HYME|nr:Histone-lysine N-methyltransferase SETMAR [Melipona quadrifasciata]
MASQIPEEIHIRHCTLFEFHKGSSNATVATKNICDVYPSALDVCKCQRWFCKFKSGNFYLSDSYRSRRPTTLDNDILRAEVEANSCQTIEELSNTLNQPSSTIQDCSRLVKCSGAEQDTQARFLEYAILPRSSKCHDILLLRGLCSTLRGRVRIWNVLKGCKRQNERTSVKRAAFLKITVAVRERCHATIPTVWVQARTGKIYWFFLSTLSRPASPETLGHKAGLGSKQTKPLTAD